MGKVVARAVAGRCGILCPPGSLMPWLQCGSYLPFPLASLWTPNSPKDRYQASSPRATLTFPKPGDEGIMNPIHYTGEEAQRC